VSIKVQRSRKAIQVRNRVMEHVLWIRHQSAHGRSFRRFQQIVYTEFFLTVSNNITCHGGSVTGLLAGLYCYNSMVLVLYTKRGKVLQW
jgi:hypothetical protein